MGRGSSKAGGVTGGGAGGRSINVLKTTDVWSFRHRPRGTRRSIEERETLVFVRNRTV